MKKIISLFQRNYEGDRLVRNEVVPGAEWVLAGEGIATQKLDGSACMVLAGKLYKRYEMKPKRKQPPAGFIPAQEPDPVTKKQSGWVPVGDGPEDLYHRQAGRYTVAQCGALRDGTYELCGPKVQGNPEGYEHHVLIQHGTYELVDAPRDYEGIKRYLEQKNIEGIVWHHPDGRMVKIKKRDFGFFRVRPHKERK